MCAFPFSHKEGKLLGLVLVAVDAAGQGIAFGIGQGIAYGVAARYNACSVALLYSQCHILYANVCHCAKANEERAADVLCLLRYVEAYGVAPVPTFGR